MLDLLKKHWTIHLIVLIFFIFSLQYFSYVPIWDGATYTIYGFYDVFETKPFNIFQLYNNGHPVILLHLLLGFPWFFYLGNVFLLRLMIGILYSFSVYAFYGIARMIFKGSKNNTEIVILTALFAFYPVNTSTILQLTTGDIGIIIFFPIFLYFYIRRRHLLSFLSALVLSFSKETGFLIFLTVLGVEFFIKFAGNRSIKTLTSLLKKRLIYAAPVILYLISILVRILIFHEAPIYKYISQPLIADWPEWQIDKIFQSYFLGILAVNYNWILTVTILAGILKYIYSSIMNKPEKILSLNKPYIRLILLLFIFLLFTLTLFKTFTNLRYFASLYFLMIILFYYSLKILFDRIIIRRIILFIVTVVFIFSNFRTTDPVSKKIYGTFKFGEHEMLNMTSITNECCGYGRDQIMYNLEYLNIIRLLDKILTDLRVTSDTAIAYQPLVGLWGIDTIDNLTYKRTYKKWESFEANIVTWKWWKMPETPRKIYYIDFPISDSSLILADYMKYYDLITIKNYVHDGYEMNVYSLKLKEEDES